MKKLIFAMSFLVLAVAMGCRQESTQTSVSEAEPAKIDQAFAQLFDTVNVVKMHVFSAAESANYPYSGTAIEAEHQAWLSDELKPGEGGAVYACYWLENDDSYLLRIRQDKSSNLLVLARFDPESGKLKKINDLATHVCNASECKQMDAWFIDLDDDRDLELITLSMTLDTLGNKMAEEFAVMARNDQGIFVKADEKLAALAPQDRYVPSNQH